MVDRVLVESRLADMRRSAIRLKELAVMDPGRLSSDPDAFAIGEHHLRRALEAVLDIGRHIVARRGLGRPADYTDIIDLLGQNGILPPELSGTIRGMAGYRNRLVHLYADVTPQELHTVIVRHLDDFQEFAQHILRYLDSQPPANS